MDMNKKIFGLSQTDAAAIATTLIGVFAWVYSYTVIYICSTYIGAGPLQLSFFLYFLLPSMLIAGLGILSVFYRVPQKFNIRPRTISLTLLYIHSIWADYVHYVLPEDFNSILVVFNYLFAICYLNLIAGAIASFIFSTSMGLLAYVTILLSDHTFGADDYLFYAVVTFTATCGSLTHGYTARLRQNLKNARDSARRKSKSLRIFDEQKTNFFQGISHDLRSPLTLILNPIENLKTQLPGDNDVKLIADNSARLLRLVNQLLDFQRLSSGKVKETLIPINIISLLDACMNNFKLACEKKKITLIGKYKIDECLHVNASTDSLEKIFFNFFSNALKYTKEGGTITAEVIKNDEKVKVLFHDTGVGIPENDLDNIFHIFSQISSGDTTSEARTGLGLALIKEIAQNLGGQTGVKSELGKGSTFWVEFPFVSAKPTIDLLIVDDELAILDAIEKAIVTDSEDIENYRTTEDPIKAKRIIEKNNVKCIVSDARMPKLSGMKLLEFAAKIQPESKRILITGQNDPKILQDAVNESKIHNFVLKPLNMKQLSKYISTYITESSFNRTGEKELADFTPQTFDILVDNTDNLNTKSETQDIPQEDGKLILFIDDIAAMRDMVAQLLREAGYKVITASNGEEGLKKAEKHCLDLDLIITDWLMPKMNGQEMISKFKEIPKLSTIPTIVLSAKADEESRAESRAVGANAYIGKPFTKIELLTIVENLLKLKSNEKTILELNKFISDKVLKRYLPPALIDDVVAGRKSISNEPKISTVSVLFADLCKFTDNSSTHGPQIITSLLNDYFTTMTDIIIENNGTVDKFMGDSIMVLFGDFEKISSEVQAAKAYNCALQMQQTMDSLNSKWKEENHPEFQLRIGIHQGPAIVGNFGGEKRSDYTAIGNTVNMASRIEKVTEPGQIFFSDIIRDFLPSESWKEAGTFSMKGFHGKKVLYKSAELKNK
jgi:signal transduction histidine kinase/class 3 adenylate cyclase